MWGEWGGWGLGIGFGMGVTFVARLQRVCKSCISNVAYWEILRPCYALFATTAVSHTPGVDTSAGNGSCQTARAFQKRRIDHKASVPPVSALSHDLYAIKNLRECPGQYRSKRQARQWETTKACSEANAAVYWRKSRKIPVFKALTFAAIYKKI